nr:ATP synthase F0 subunit 8 [Stenochironomus zhengi]UKO33049.1 ATP synthase F0 subunit 8 [Stenochironomus zhengi]
MPQMAPTLWILLFLFFLMLIIFTSIIIYHNPNPANFSKK